MTVLVPSRVLLTGAPGLRFKGDAAAGWVILPAALGGEGEYPWLVTAPLKYMSHAVQVTLLKSAGQCCSV